MNEKKYTRQHEWLQLEEDEDGQTALVGISEHAQEQLGDVVYVELPEVGAQLEAEGAMAVVESNKAASDVYAPVSGEVLEVNNELEERPELVNESAEGDGWLARLRVVDVGEADALMSAEEYDAFLQTEDAH